MIQTIPARFAKKRPNALALKSRKAFFAYAFFVFVACGFVLLLTTSVAFLALPAFAQSRPSANTTWAVTIVLPPRVVAGRQATLAVFGTDGRLAPNVSVDLGISGRVITDATGRARFVVPLAGSVLLAKYSGNSAAALIDPEKSASGSPATASITPVAGLHDRFVICGAGFSGDALADQVRINGAFALVVAASPECLVVLPPQDAAPGPAKVSVTTPPTDAPPNSPTPDSAPRSLAPVVSTPGPFALVSLDFSPPAPPLQPGKRSVLAVRVHGSDQPLRLFVENETPNILAFRHGDSQETRTTGGARNAAEIEAQAIGSGDYSFHARVLPAPDPAAAARYLEAAAEIAPRDSQAELRSLANRLDHHPNDAENVRRQIQDILTFTIPGDLHTLLDAAHSAL